ncbi:MAG TPA: ABC transporter ATP-binding protein [Patescibacteria group bacterium]|nr:ABC transporter ATP-binding protein [Patescibacteria group bacterium]
MDPIIRTKNVNVTYTYGETKFRACKNASIDIYPGEFVVIFGPSGSGKSTLLYAISGLERVDSGEIWIKDVCVTSARHDDLVKVNQTEYGFIFQSYNLINRLTCFENVILPGAIAALPRDEVKSRAEKLLKRFGIWEHRNKYPTNLSGGQQQRVAISRSLVNNPSILLADEPVGNLDSTNAKLVMSIMMELNEEGITLILVTHDPAYIKYAHRTAYIRDGEIVRVQANANRKQIKPPSGDESQRNRMDLLMDSYPELVIYGFPHMEPIVKAKMIAQYLVNPLESKQMQNLELAIEQFLLKKLNHDQFISALLSPVNEKGAGLARRQAEKFSRMVGEVMNEGVIASKQGDSDSLSKADSVATRLRAILKDDYNLRFSQDQQKSFDTGLEMRLASQVKKDEFEDFLQRSRKKGGVGFTPSRARDIAREVELAILVGYEEEK